MKPALMAMLFVLLGSAAGLASNTRWREYRVADLGILLPTGNGWEVTEHESGEGRVAMRVQRNVDGDPEYFYVIQVYFNQVPRIYHDWLPVEVATDYLLLEIDNMQVEGVDKGEFSLPELDVYEEQHGGFTLHVLRNVKDYIEPWTPTLELEAQELYLVFPENFSDTTTFYKIFISADCFFEGCTVDDLDLSEMTPLLDDLRDYSEASD